MVRPGLGFSASDYNNKKRPRVGAGPHTVAGAASSAGGSASAAAAAAADAPAAAPATATEAVSDIKLYGLRIVDKLAEKDAYSIFARPVDEDEVPGYHDIIKHPMDLSTIRSRLDRCGYRNLQELRQDIDLMWDNCTVFNDASTIFAKTAVQLRSVTAKLFKTARENVNRAKARRGSQPAPSPEKPGPVSSTRAPAPEQPPGVVNRAASVSGSVSSARQSRPKDQGGDGPSPGDHSYSDHEKRQVKKPRRLASRKLGSDDEDANDDDFGEDAVPRQPTLIRPKLKLEPTPAPTTPADEESASMDDMDDLDIDDEPEHALPYTRPLSPPPRFIPATVPKLKLDRSLLTDPIYSKLGSKPKPNPVRPVNGLHSIKAKDYAASLLAFVSKCTSETPLKIVDELLSPETAEAEQDAKKLERYTQAVKAAEQRKKAGLPPQSPAPPRVRTNPQSFHDARMVNGKPPLAPEFSPAVAPDILNEVMKVGIEEVNFYTPYGVTKSALSEIASLAREGYNLSFLDDLLAATRDDPSTELRPMNPPHVQQQAVRSGGVPSGSLVPKPARGASTSLTPQFQQQQQQQQIHHQHLRAQQPLAYQQPTQQPLVVRPSSSRQDHNSASPTMGQGPRHIQGKVPVHQGGPAQRQPLQASPEKTQTTFVNSQRIRAGGVDEQAQASGRLESSAHRRPMSIQQRPAHEQVSSIPTGQILPHRIGHGGVNLRHEQMTQQNRVAVQQPHMRASPPGPHPLSERPGHHRQGTPPTQVKHQLPSRPVPVTVSLPPSRSPVSEGRETQNVAGQPIGAYRGQTVRSVGQRGPDLSERTAPASLEPAGQAGHVTIPSSSRNSDVEMQEAVTSDAGARGPQGHRVSPSSGLMAIAEPQKPTGRSSVLQGTAPDQGTGGQASLAESLPNGSEVMVCTKCQNPKDSLYTSPDGRQQALCKSCFALYSQHKHESRGTGMAWHASKSKPRQPREGVVGGHPGQVTPSSIAGGGVGPAPALDLGLAASELNPGDSGAVLRRAVEESAAQNVSLPSRHSSSVEDQQTSQEPPRPRSDVEEDDSDRSPYPDNLAGAF